MCMIFSPDNRNGWIDWNLCIDRFSLCAVCAPLYLCGCVCLFWIENWLLICFVEYFVIIIYGCNTGCAMMLHSRHQAYVFCDCDCVCISMRNRHCSANGLNFIENFHTIIENMPKTIKLIICKMQVPSERNAISFVEVENLFSVQDLKHWILELESEKLNIIVLLLHRQVQMRYNIQQTIRRKKVHFMGRFRN